MKVIQKNGSIDKFDEKKIAESIEKETDLNASDCVSISRYVKKKLKKSKVRIVTGPLIREAVCMALLHYGYERARYQYTRVGMPLYDAISFDGGAGTGDNANLHLSPETIHKRKADRLAKEQALLQMPKSMADMHLSGDLHIHDLEYFTTRPFCFDHDLRFTFYYGLVCDGTGEHTSVAGPAMRPEVAIMHAAKVLGASQTNCAGGQGFYNFLCFLAPFFKGADYKTYKQCMQMFVYEMTQMLVARGGQSLRYDELLIIKDENDVISLQKIGCFCHKYVDGEGIHVFTPEFKKCKTLSLNKETGELEWKFINGVYAHKPYTQLKETKITDGRAVITTSDHSLFTLDENCNIVEISPSERPDTILTAKRIPFNGYYQNPDLMFLIGACIGDGNLIDNNGNEKSAMRIAVSSRNVANRISEYVSEYGLSKCEWKRPKDGRNLLETSFSTKNIPYITEIGIGASNKRIPEEILSSNVNALYSLLNGLISTDGNVSRRRYEYNTTSETLAKQIEFILMRLGLEYSISSSMKHSNFNRNYPVYVIRISASDSKKIHITNENRQIKSLNGAKQQKHNFAAIKSLVKRYLGVGSYKYGYTFKSNTRKLKRDDLESISHKIPDIWSKVKNILPMEVKSILPNVYEEFVYDIGVDDNENFVLYNGIICHNTVFASVQLAPGIPKLWRDIPVVSHGKIHEETYGNYELENRLLFKALMEVMIEGDASGKPFYFPKPEINIAQEFLTDEYEELYDLAFELSAKFGTPYFDNTTPKYRHSDGISCYQCSIHPDSFIQSIDCGGNLKLDRIKNFNSEMVNTPSGFSKYSEISIHDVNEELFEIILKGGRRLIATPDHRMPTEDRGKIFVCDLSPDDKLNINCWLPCDKEMELYNGFGDDISLSYLLGLYAAEGTTYNNGSNKHVYFCFGVHETDLIEKCKNLISFCFNYDAKWNYVNNKKGYQVSIHSNAIYDWFSKIGIGMKGYDMRIPHMLFSAKKECKMAFLLGYYRGDGTFRLNGKLSNQRRIEMNTISEEFAEGLLLLSGSLGFNFKYGIYKDKRENRKIRHILTLNEYSEIKKFFAGIFSEHLDIWVKIRKINLIQYSGPVYDIVEVEKKSVFITGQGIVSSNCAYQFNSNSETDTSFNDKLHFINGQHFSMGSWQVITLNLPRLAYKAKDVNDFIDKAQKLINSCLPIFRYKRECMQKMIDNRSLGFLQQRMTSKEGNTSPVYADFDSLVYTVGVIGLNEVVAILSGKEIYTDEGSKLALKICAELKKHCKTMSEFLGSTIAFARTPAETTGQRFAYLDFKAGYDVICQGDKEEAFKLQEIGISDVPIYYTNGTHVPPAANVMPSERLRIEQAFFPVLDGGNITHIWLGEQSPSVGGLKDMAMKICKTNCGYFSFTRDFTTRTRFYRLYKQ